MIRKTEDKKGLVARLRERPFSNIYALSALMGYPADDRFYSAYLCGRRGGLVLCGAAAYPYLPAAEDAEEAAEFLRVRGVRSVLCDFAAAAALARHMPAARLDALFMFAGEPADMGEAAAAEDSVGMGEAGGAKTPAAYICARGQQERVHALLCACFADVPPLREYVQAQDQRRLYLGGCTAVCEAGGQIVAAGSILCKTDAAALIGGLACAPEYRGRGFARAVTEALRRAARGRTPCLIAEEKMRPFYAHLGFQEICAMAQITVE